jgi:hypothetical protein
MRPDDIAVVERRLHGFKARTRKPDSDRQERHLEILRLKGSQP